MKLYNAAMSPNALRVRAVVAELGVEADIVDVDLRSGEQKSDWFLSLNPNGKVPVLVDGDFVLWESRAIDAYLAGLKPECGLYPTELKVRAIIDQWSYWNAVHLSPTIQRVVFERLLKKMFGMGEPDEDTIAPQLNEMAQLLPVLESDLADREWVAGDLSIADFAMASTFVYRAGARISLDEFPNISAWLARMEARPSWQAAVAPLAAMTKR